MSSETPQWIVISGQLKLTSTTGSFVFPQGSEIIMADASSGIVVESGTSLRLENMYIHGCAVNWDRILAKSGATLVVEGCTITDGLDALHVEQGAITSIKGNVFLRNRTAILLGSNNVTAGSISFTTSGGISGNTFRGGYLLSPLITLSVHSREGISFLNISSEVEVKNNIFEDFTHTFTINDPPRYGIFVNNSKVKITACSFTNIPFGGAVMGQNNSEIAFTGMGTETTSISSCGGGVSLTNSNLIISNTKMDNIAVGVLHTKTNTSNVNFLRMDNCNISNFLRLGIGAVSSVGTPLGLSEFSVINSKFVSGQNTTSNDAYAIQVESRVATSVQKVDITNNNIIRSGNSDLRGILISQIDPTSSPASYLRITNNSITNNLTGVPNQPLFTGIQLNNSHYVTVNDNDISMPGGSSNTGIYVVSSYGYKIRCNMINDADWGIRFKSNNTSSNGLYQNTFSNCSIGLFLEQIGDVTATIGVQKFGLNSWPGTPLFNGKEAFFQFFSFDPTNDEHKQEVQKSMFIINGFDQSSQYWATPRSINSTPDNNIWFKGQSASILALSCPISTFPGGEEVSLVEKSVQNGTFSAYLGIEANKWDAEFILLDRLTKETDLLAAGSDELLWYNSNQASTLRQLHSAYIGYMELGNDNVVGATNLLTSLSAVTTSKLHEQNMKDVLSVLLEKYIQGGGDFTEVQSKTLTNIAMQCRLEGGLAVELARGALGITKDLDTDCGKKSEDRWSKNNQNTVLVTNISPNPAREQTQITLSDDITDGVISVYNLTGQLVGKWSMSGKTAQISTMDMNAGIYMVEISVSGKTIVHSKLSVIK